MNYLEKKELLENQGWTVCDKRSNDVVFAKSDVQGLLIVVNCITGDDIVYAYCTKDYLDKHLPHLEEEEND